MKRSHTAWVSLLTLLVTTSGAWADWQTLVIRNGTTSGNPPTIADNNDYGVAAKEFIIVESGQKAAWGTWALDGFTVGQIAQLAVMRLDDSTRFPAGSGPRVAPYFNLWITDGAGNYAVIGNEPSDPVFQALYDGGYDLSWADIADKVAKVYENNDKSWLPNTNGAGLTFDDIKDFVIQAPSVAELTTGWDGLSGGAPRELGTNVAYGFNWVLGDTLSNYVSGDPGYVLAEPAAGPFITTDYTVIPQILAAGKPEFSAPHGTGDNPFGYDWDSAAPETAAGAPDGYGTSSFYASVAQDGATDADRYRTLRIGMRSLFGREVTVGEVAKVSYHTNKPAPQTAIDWRFSIYTTWDPAGGNSASWYCSRIQTHPYASLNLDAPADTWNLWSTAAGTNQLQFYQSNRTGFSSIDMLWSEITSGPVTRGSYTWDYSGEEVMMIDLSLGANSGGGTGASQVDGVRIELTNGQIADIDLAVGTAWQVATVHGHDQFEISEDGSELLYHAQPRNTKGWYWYQNNGADPNVLATGGLQEPDGWRDGSRTFAVSDVAVGKKLNELKLVCEYNTTLGGYATINFFLTDGNGKFGIFAPNSGGLGSVAQIEVLDADWSRLTIDLTNPSIPDTATVAVYEHNGFIDVYGNPYTTMTWGDIKEYTIAGMYDYQRSPALGWNKWGTMFDPINAAGDDTLVNGYGLALIWGDTVGNTTYATQQRRIREVEVSFDGMDYVGAFADAQIRDILELNVNDTSLYVQPGETVVIDMDVLNLLQPVNGCQALLGYDSTYLTDPSVAAGGGDVWDQMIFQNYSDLDGELDAAVGVDVQANPGGTQANGTVAKVTFATTAEEGITLVAFRADESIEYATMLSSMASEPVWPTKFDSQTIVIDGTDPVVTALTATQDQGAGAVDVLNCATTTLQGTALQGTAVAISVDALDVLAGLAAEPVVTVTQGGDALTVTYVGESPAGTFNYTVDIEADTANGTWTIEAIATDKAGNDASVSGTLCVDKNQITGDIELEGFVGTSREVTFVASGGATSKTWTLDVTGFSGAVASFTLTQVPDGTTDVSAKTAWTLRSKVALGDDGNNQWTADLTGDDMLLGGDLNGSNFINILDYSVLANVYGSTIDPVADINGSGKVNVGDYDILAVNYFKAGDAE